MYMSSVILFFHRDLLCGSTSTERLEVKMNPEGGLYVPGLTYTHVQSLDEINEVGCKPYNRDPHCA